MTDEGESVRPVGGRGDVSSNTVFISYAREDARYAERLYMDLRKAGVDAWLDTKRLLPGQDWRAEIRRVIHEAAFFIAITSANSLNKRGFVQSEMRRALRTLDEVPAGQSFVIQVRLDETVPQEEVLQSLSWIDLFPNYERGLERILAALSHLERAPLEMRSPLDAAGARAPISYAPYRGFAEFAKDLIERLPTSASMADRDYAMYVHYRTDVEGVRLPPHLLAKFPSEIRIVLQHQFENLTALTSSFTVVLWFDGIPHTLEVPYLAILDIDVPTIGLGIRHYAVPGS